VIGYEFLAAMVARFTELRLPRVQRPAKLRPVTRIEPWPTIWLCHAT
jgi:hypothetical protein